MYRVDLDPAASGQSRVSCIYTIRWRCRRRRGGCQARPPVSPRPSSRLLLLLPPPPLVLLPHRKGAAAHTCSPPAGKEKCKLSEFLGVLDDSVRVVF